MTYNPPSLGATITMKTSHHHKVLYMVGSSSSRGTFCAMKLLQRITCEEKIAKTTICPEMHLVQDQVTSNFPTLRPNIPVRTSHHPKVFYMVGSSSSRGTICAIELLQRITYEEKIAKTTNCCPEEQLNTLRGTR